MSEDLCTYSVDDGVAVLAFNRPDHMNGMTGTEPDLSAHDALVNAAGLMAESLAGADVGEGVASFLERRQVTFPPLGKGTGFDWMKPR